MEETENPQRAASSYRIWLTDVENRLPEGSTEAGGSPGQMTVVSPWWQGRCYTWSAFKYILIEEPIGFAERFEMRHEIKKNQGWPQGVGRRQLGRTESVFTETEKPETEFLSPAGSGRRNLEFSLALHILSLRCLLDIQRKILSRQLDVCVRRWRGNI